jgi:hypothetical protein
MVMLMVRQTTATRPCCTSAETANAGGRNGKVAFLGRFKISGLTIVHDRARQFRGVLRRECLVRHRVDLAVDLDRWREASGDEQVGALLLRHQSQQVVHEF